MSTLGLPPKPWTPGGSFIVEEQKRSVCLHPRCKTRVKGSVWQCRLCKEILFKGLNERKETV